MRYPQLLLCESQRGLGELLRELAAARKWLYRVRHRPASCLRLLRRGHSTVLVVRIGTCLFDRSLERECKLLERVAWLFPDTVTIAVCDIENASLVSLAYDLGAAYVLSTAQCRDQLPDVVIGLMNEAVRRAASA